MAKKKIWDVQVMGAYHQVTFNRNLLTIDNQIVKLKELPREKMRGHIIYTIDVAGQPLRLCVSNYNTNLIKLTMNGIDIETGLPYEPQALPKWVWVFWSLFIVNIALILGGALGFALNFGGAACVGAIAANENMSTRMRVGISIGIWFAFTVVELLAVIFIIGVKYSL